MDSDIPNQPGIMSGKLGNFSENDATDITPDSSIMERTDWFSRFKGAARMLGNANATLGTVDDYGREITAPEPQEDVKTLQANYPQLPGQPAFDSPMPDSVAKGIYEHQQDENRIAEAKSRAPAGFWNGAAQYGTQFAADMLDPLNIASMFVPVVGEERLLAEGAGIGGQILARVGAGAINGTAGQVPLIALQYAQSRMEKDDYSAVNAMTDLAMGAGMGAFFRTAIAGPISDLLGRRMAASHVQASLEADPGLRQAALKTAISQAATDSPTQVLPIFDAAGLRSATEARDNFLNDAAAVENIVPGSPAALRINAIDEELGGGQRLASIEAELGTAIPAARREALEHERSLITEGASPERTQALQEERSHIIALEGARAEAQRSGLLDAAERSETDITSHLQAKHAQDYAALEQMAKDSGTDIHAAYQQIATAADAPLEDMERAYQQIRASEAAPGGARSGEQPAVPGPNESAGAAGAGQIGSTPESGPAVGTAGEGSRPAGGASPAAGAGAGATERAGPVARDAELALKQKTAADEAQRAANGEPSADAQRVTAESVAAAKVAPGEDMKKAAQDVLDHQQFFKAAEAAGALDDDAKAALQEGAAAIDNDAKSMTNAALQAAACIARGLS
jgi:hypothetical protein